ncbi:helix-turn-helix domain-containing protein [Paenibacillus plantarum]|uniref:helix-turn-helix domain-containing protein n=1 Tax=Paenibacillus plantarum TaxID=2654975 RepID=UPI0014914624|nr:AraC family transcriptional regulator [Paenibacillus plantarum]
MLKLWRFSWKTNSLFAKLMTSFLVVIAVLAVFNFISFLFLKSKIYEEIVKYNQSNLNHTVDQYENHFRLVRETIISLNQDDIFMANLNLLRNVQKLNAYDKVDNVMSVIKVLIANPFLSIDNIMLYFKNDSYVVEKEGTSGANDLFSRYYASSAYLPEFWFRQFDESYTYRLIPTSSFTEISANIQKNKGQLLPAIVKLMPYKDMYFIVMLNPTKMFNSYHYSDQFDLYIINEEGVAIFSSSPSMKAPLNQSFEGQNGSFTNNNLYYFYQKGQLTGLTYVSVVPIKSISNQLLRLNIVFITLLVIIILLSIITSVVLTMRLNRPVKKIIEAVQQRHPSGVPVSSPIYEFNMISEKMSSILRTNDQITEDLDKKKDELRYYAYTNKLRNIHMNLTELRELVVADTPFTLVLYQLTMKDKFGELDSELEKAVYFIREYINIFLSQTFKDTITFQMDKDTAITLLFGPDETADIESALEQLIQVLEVDRDLFFLTIAVSPIYPDSGHLISAYEYASTMLLQRKLNDETQLIRTFRPAKGAVHFTVLVEEEFSTRLMSGNEQSLLDWIHRQLDALCKREASVDEFRRFAKEVYGQLNKSIMKLNLHREQGELPPLVLNHLNSFYNIEKYKQWFKQLISPAIERVNHKKSEHDRMTYFILEYLVQHLEQDITLDIMADKLNITSSYLSTYFKEKTGANFSDYLNGLRMQKAKELLNNLDLKIQDVSVKVGYQNVNSFIRMFKRYSGITPGEYRKRYGTLRT